MPSATLASMTVRLLVLGAASLALAACGGATPHPFIVPGTAGSAVDVGGHLLYFECGGRGSPRVLLESGIGVSARSWRAVEVPLAAGTRVCGYDRAGVGGSESADKPRTTRDEIRDLERLLERADITPPYVLVGQDYGGIVVRAFAAAHPRDVAGVVLVDALHPDFPRRALDALPAPHAGEDPRLTVLRDALRTPRVATIREFRTAGDLELRRSLGEASSLGGLGDIPLVVLTAGVRDSTLDGPGPDLERVHRVWLATQRDLARLSPDSVHAIARRGDHLLQSTLTGQPPVVLRAVRAVVRAVRLGKRLPSCARIFDGLAVRCVA
jgi:pimeloyl-ACP methyl ester carboxylesterase